MWLFIWVGLAVLIGYYYKQKGLNSAFGFFLSLFASPLVAFIIGAILSPESKVFEKLKKCPQCAEFVKAEAKICRFCNYEFKEEEKRTEKVITEEEWLQQEVRKKKQRRLNLVFFTISVLGTIIAFLLILTFINRQIESTKKTDIMKGRIEQRR
jgi:RNA polymerase subunit RPABC4/transcription elongation factor Spt4